MSVLGYAPMLIRPVSTNGYLAVTNTYLNSDATLLALSTPIKDGIDRWFRDLNGYANGSYTTYNVWSRLIAIYPMIGGTSTSSAKNAKSPGVYDLTHSGSPTITTNGIAYNGSSQYSDTNYTPPNSGSWATNEPSTFGVHRRDTNGDTNATIGIATGGNTYGIIRGDNFRNFVLGAGSGVAGGGTLGINALWQTGMLTSTSQKSYRNGAVVNSASISFGSTGNNTLFIGAFRGGAGAGYGGANTVDYVYFGQDTWSDAEQTFMYDTFNALQTILGR